MLTQESGALHDVRANQGGSNERNKACFKSTIECQVHQGKLEACTNTAQEVEASTRNLGATSHVDSAEAFTQFQVILGLEVEGGDSSHFTQRDKVVFTTGRNAFNDGVLNFAGSFGVGLISSSCCSVSFLDLRSELGNLSKECLLLVTLCLTDLLAEHVLFCAQLFERGQRSTTLCVCLQGNVDEAGIRSASHLRGSNNVWVFAKQYWVNHMPSLR